MVVTGLLILLGIIYLIFYIFKKIGVPKIGKIISISLILIVLYLIIISFFEDYFFTKNDAEMLLNQQNIILKDDFQIIKNESMTAIGEYYMTFKIKISNNDKNRIVNEIKKSKNFTTNDISVETLIQNENIDTHFGKRIVLNHETKLFFVRELFEPNGDGFAPTWTNTKVNKFKNELIFEDIDE